MSHSLIPTLTLSFLRLNHRIGSDLEERRTIELPIMLLHFSTSSRFSDMVTLVRSNAPQVVYR
jgi:hypothetical protein